ncbi:MAG: hypothetical protein COA80_17730 [Leeuwenhoekiella sp.]|nr:MAG: hypothetical protein COA80_17730 [Leeuwenhoekiella sp.]
MTKGKKILLIAPFNARGGREIEACLITEALLKNNFEPLVVSITFFPKKHIMQDHFDQKYFTSVYGQLLKHPMILFFAGISMLKNKFKYGISAFASNDWSKRYGKFDMHYKDEIFQLVKNAQVVLFLGQLTSPGLKQIISACNQENIPIIFRMTGILDFFFRVPDYIKNVSTFVHQSESNYSSNLTAVNSNFHLIDQCALAEEQLLSIPPLKSKIKNYLVIGELGEAKGTRILASYFCKYGLESETLTFIGAGEELEDLRNKYRSKSNIVFAGQIRNIELFEYFSKSHCLLIGSIIEAGPLVGIEAMAAGRIIISTRVGAMSDRLEETNNQFWFDRKNEHSFENVLSHVRNLSKKDTQEISIQLKQRYKEKYKKNIIQRHYLELITKYA